MRVDRCPPCCRPLRVGQERVQLDPGCGKAWIGLVEHFGDRSPARPPRQGGLFRLGCRSPVGLQLAEDPEGRQVRCGLGYRSWRSKVVLSGWSESIAAQRSCCTWILKAIAESGSIGSSGCSGDVG